MCRPSLSSSCTVYGEPERVPLDESHPVGGVSSPYGRTKFQMEEIIRDHSSANPNFKAGVLRYFNPVGAHPSGEIGEDPNGIPDNLVPFLCQVATGQREKLRVFGSDYPPGWYRGAGLPACGRSGGCTLESIGSFE